MKSVQHRRIGLTGRHSLSTNATDFTVLLFKISIPESDSTFWKKNREKAFSEVGQHGGIAQMEQTAAWKLLLVGKTDIGELLFFITDKIFKADFYAIVNTN